MTCVVGLEHKGKVYMGADSAAYESSMIWPSRLDKVFHVEAFLIGYTESFRFGQLLRYHLKVPKQTKTTTDLEYLVIQFIPKVQAVLSEGGFSPDSDSKGDCGKCLLGYRGTLYLIDEDFQVNTSHHGYTAIGAGEEYAMGSLFSTAGSPTSRVMGALEAAVAFSPQVSAPCRVWSI